MVLLISFEVRKDGFEKPVYIIGKNPRMNGLL